MTITGFEDDHPRRAVNLSMSYPAPINDGMPPVFQAQGRMDITLRFGDYYQAADTLDELATCLRRRADDALSIEHPDAPALGGDRRPTND